MTKSEVAWVKFGAFRRCLSWNKIFSSVLTVSNINLSPCKKKLLEKLLRRHIISHLGWFQRQPHPPSPLQGIFLEKQIKWSQMSKFFLFFSFTCRHIQSWEFTTTKIDHYHKKCAWNLWPNFFHESSILFLPLAA